MGEVTVTPEYGPPYPYQSAGGDAELWAQTLAAGEHLRRVFDQWVEETERTSDFQTSDSTPRAAQPRARPDVVVE